MKRCWPSLNIVKHVQTSLESLLLSMPIVLISATKYAESGQLPSSLWFMDFHPSYQAPLYIMTVVMYIGWRCTVVLYCTVLYWWLCILDGAHWAHWH